MNGMNFSVFPPHEALCDYVYGYTLLEIDVPIPKEHKHPLYPNGIIGIHFDLESPIIGIVNGGKWRSVPQSFLNGQMTKIHHIACPGKLKHLSIIFYCNGFYHLTGIPPKFFTDQIMCLGDLGKEWMELDDQLRNCRAAANYKSIIDHFLLALFFQRKIQPGYADQLLALYQSSAESFSMDLAMEELRVTDRRLRQVFNEITGLSPIKYFNIRRFQKVLNYLKQNPKARLSDVASQFGYFDQPHLTRDFKEKTGLTPSKFKRKEFDFSEEMVLKD